MYKLVNAQYSDIQLLIKYKLSTIYEYADNLSEEEIKEIEDYVKKTVPNLLDKYKVIIDNKIIGCLLVTEYEDGFLLDEIYIEEHCRNKGIGGSLIENIINKHDVVYLWVYKKNKRAISLYERYGFYVVKETETRYLMKVEYKKK